ncbi:MAG TPA: c-type cytochrome [Azospira sp.]|nr:c-type cytochrome [Azospira sp.]
MADNNDHSSKSIMYWSIAAAIVLMVLIVPLSKLGKGSAGGASAEDADARIAPVAKVALQVAGAAAPSGPVDPKSVYNGVCAACHASGAAGAPKAGDKAAWAPRIAQGKDTLYKNAIGGKGAMPPKGGASLADDDFKKVVDYLVGLAK